AEGTPKRLRAAEAARNARKPRRSVKQVLADHLPAAALDLGKEGGGRALAPVGAVVDVGAGEHRLVVPGAFEGRDELGARQVLAGGLGRFPDEVGPPSTTF